MTSWKDDHTWSRRFLPEIKRILGEHLIVEAPFEDDARHNTDLVVLRLDQVRIACRIRRHCYLSRYGNEITIRSGRPSGAASELTKIIAGWGDYLFYGFANAQEDGLAQWLLGDLKVFRLYWARCLWIDRSKMPGQQRANGDGSSEFFAFRVDEMPANFVVARGSTGNTNGNQLGQGGVAGRDLTSHQGGRGWLAITR